MGYDIRLEIDTGGPERAWVAEPAHGNYTYNVSPMFRRALGDEALDERLAADVIPVLRKAVADMEDHPAEYRAMNPTNGRGDSEGALEVLRALLEACVAHPKATVVFR